MYLLFTFHKTAVFAFYAGTKCFSIGRDTYSVSGAGSFIIKFNHEVLLHWYWSICNPEVNSLNGKVLRTKELNSTIVNITLDYNSHSSFPAETGNSVEDLFY